MGLMAAGLMVALTCATSYAGTQVVHIEVDAAIIRPIDGQGMNWDGPGGGQATIASEGMKKAGEKLVASYLIEAGVGVGLASRAARYAIDAMDKAFAPPDPFGEIVVDGRVVGALDVLQDNFAPAWKTPARFVELTPSSSVVEVTLIDEDLSGAHDPIGTCTFKVPPLKDSAPVTLTSKACRDDLLAASIIVRLAPPPQRIVPGRYRIATARAGLPPTDRDGTEWDVSGLPDPQIEVTVGAKRFVCPTNQGQRAGVCDPSLTFEVDDKTTIVFRVVDVDPGFDDLVGSAAVADLATRQTHRPIAMGARGLEWAELVLTPVPR